MISAIHAKDDNGRACWDVYEIEDVDNTADRKFTRIARYRTNQEARAFMDGCGWPEFKMKLFGVRFAYEIRRDQEESAAQAMEG